MKRRSLLLLGALTPIALFTSRYLGARTRTSLPGDDRERAQQLNQLAGNIRTPADARRFVDFIAEIFSEETPPGWTNGSLRERIAQAEFSAVSDSQRLIPEARVAEAWNAYMGTLQAPKEYEVTAAEIHNLRDAFLTTARISWNRGSRNIWAVPSIYATLPDGRLAPGCRAVESIRVLWDLANMPGNLKSARDRTNRGVLASDMFRDAQSKPSQRSTTAHVEMRVSSNPVRIAASQYVKANGMPSFGTAVITMLDRTLA